MALSDRRSTAVELAENHHVLSILHAGAFGDIAPAVNKKQQVLAQLQSIADTFVSRSTDTIEAELTAGGVFGYMANNARFDGANNGGDSGVDGLYGVDSTSSLFNDRETLSDRPLSGNGATAARGRYPRWARVVPYGSLALGAVLNDGDIDACLIAPGHITKADYFQHFERVLRSVCPGVKHFSSVTQTRVPVLKFRIDGVEVDLLFVSMYLDRAPTDAEMASMDIFDLVSIETRPSINGVRTALIIKDVVGPDRLAIFQNALRIIKLWANARNVYGNLYSYPSGVGYAVLTARLSQLFPNLCAFGVVRMFFLFYSKWISTVKPISPINLTQPLVPDTPRMQGLTDSWDPSLEAYSSDILPILNPAWPHTNTCYTVCRSTLGHIVSELNRAVGIVTQSPEEARQKYCPGTTPALTEATDSSQTVWVVPMLTELLASPFDIGIPTKHGFSDAGQPEYPVRLVVEVSATGDSYKTWYGFVESRLKLLLYALDTGSSEHGVVARPSTFDCSIVHSGTERRVTHRVGNFVVGVKSVAQCTDGRSGSSEKSNQLVVVDDKVDSTDPTGRTVLLTAAQHSFVKGCVSVFLAALSEEVSGFTKPPGAHPVTVHITTFDDERRKMATERLAQRHATQLRRFTPQRVLNAGHIKKDDTGAAEAVERQQGQFASNKRPRLVKQERHVDAEPQQPLQEETQSAQWALAQQAYISTYAAAMQQYAGAYNYGAAAAGYGLDRPSAVPDLSAIGTRHKHKKEKKDKKAKKEKKDKHSRK